MFRKKAIDEWAWDYWLLQQYAKLCFRIYFRKIEIVNLNKIPANQPVILAPNHQNALIDAMVLVCNTSFQNVFLARADIFKGKRLVKFLTYLNIMPIFRIRDGIENVKKNDVVFERTVQVLHNHNNPLGLFAEGNHGDRRRLRPLVKGLFRIAFQAQEKYGTGPGVKIIPVGIEYGHYQNFRTTLFVNIGDPMEVSEYFGEYAENPIMAINRLKDSFAESLSRQMIDIQTEEYYELYQHLREIINGEIKSGSDTKDGSLAGKFGADKVMIEMLNRELKYNPESIRELNDLVIHYQENVRKAHLRDWVFRKNGYGIAGLLMSAVIKIILFPLFLFGLVNNILPYWLTASRVRNIKDTQFHSTVKFVVGMIAFPIWYIVIAGILAFFSLPAGYIILYILMLPATGIAAFEYYIRLRKVIAKFRFSFLKNSPEIRDLQNSRSNIVNRMNTILNLQKTQP